MELTRKNNLTWEFVIFLLLAIVSTVAFIARGAFEASKAVITGLFILAGMFFIFSCVYFVPVQNVGIVTAFNAPTGRTTGAGLKVVWPWEEVTDFDASKITSDHANPTTCVTARIGSLATACFEAKIQWQVEASAAPKLYRDYRGNFDNLKNNFVELNIQNAINAVAATYNPLSQINLQTGQVSFDGAKLAEDVKARLITTIGGDIKILVVSIPIVHHDQKTESNIQAFQDVIAQSRILDQQKLNADKEAAVAKVQQSYLTPEYIQNKCIEYSLKMGVPPGLCLASSNGVIVDTKK